MLQCMRKRTLVELLDPLTRMCLKSYGCSLLTFVSFNNLVSSFLIWLPILTFGSSLLHLSNISYCSSYWGAYILLHYTHSALCFHKLWVRACGVSVTWLSLCNASCIPLLWPGPSQKPLVLSWSSCCLKTH